MPVVIVSGEPADSALLQVVDGWITKPFEEAALVDTVTAILAKADGRHSSASGITR